MRSHYESEIRDIRAEQDGNSPEQDGNGDAYSRLRHEIVHAERTAMIQLRDRGQIDDEVFRELERKLDLEELKFRTGEEIK